MFEKDIFPDEGITIGEMKDYGYKWPGMLPVRFMTARHIWKAGLCEVFRLYPDGTESVIQREEDFNEHNYDEIYGVEKEAWHRVDYIWQKWKDATQEIYNNLQEGKRYGAYITDVDFPYFETVLYKSTDKRGNDYIHWSYYGSSANLNTIESLEWIIFFIFNRNPLEFLESYACKEEAYDFCWYCGMPIEKSYSGTECPECGRKLDYKKEKEDENG